MPAAELGPPLRRFATWDVGQPFVGSAKLRGGVGGGARARLQKTS